MAAVMMLFYPKTITHLGAVRNSYEGVPRTNSISWRKYETEDEDFSRTALKTQEEVEQARNNDAIKSLQQEVYVPPRQSSIPFRNM
jgi:hypothetical protein